MVKHVYCLSGLGSDERIFGRLQWNSNWVIHYLHWLQPEQDEALSAYALRMSDAIRENNATLIGVSFGGILSIEIAKLIPVEKVILISSIETCHELPYWMSICGKLRLDTLIPRRNLPPPHLLKLFLPLENYFLGAITKEERQLANEYREKVDPYYLKWSIHQILHWKNEWVPPVIYHLHGDKDKIFPIKNVTPTHSISSGQHFMIYHCPEKISAILETII